MQTHRDPFDAWFQALYVRHTAKLQFAEIRRALQALSTVYVQRRERLGAVFDGAGKRAAFALFYTPLHFITVRHILQQLAVRPVRRVVDLGCGTGAGGAAWALQGERPTLVEGLDVNAWALTEARWNWQTLALQGQGLRNDVSCYRNVRAHEAVLAAYTVNELTDGARAELLPRLLAAGKSGAQVTIIEPIAKGISPWWAAWQQAFLAAGGRDDTWRLRPTLPDKLSLLSRAAGLQHRELTARSLHLG